MRFLLTSLCSGLLAAAQVGAQEPPAPPPPVVDALSVAQTQTIELGGGVSLPRPVFEELMRREDGMALIDRLHSRASETKSFEGMPHLIVVFLGVLLFFGLALSHFQRKHARLHRTIQLMIEKGLPLPIEILRAAEQAEQGSEGTGSAVSVATAPAWASNLLWGGLLWITIGLTGAAFLWLRGSDTWPWGLAAVAYGAGAVFTAVKKRSIS
jgi:hypothetical protein